MTLQTTDDGRLRHLLTLEGLPRAMLVALLDRAQAFLDGHGTADPRAALAGIATCTLFFEPSTRTRSSFQLAAMRLGADILGFDVLAWESGLYDVHGVWEHVRAGEDVLTASRRGIFGVWTRSQQVLPTLDYVQGTLGTARPLEMAGIDNQLRSTIVSRWLGIDR